MNDKELEMVTKLQDAEILPLDITKAKVDYMVKAVCGFLQQGKVICEGEVTGVSHYQKGKKYKVAYLHTDNGDLKVDTPINVFGFMGKKIQIIIKEI